MAQFDANTARVLRANGWQIVGARHESAVRDEGDMHLVVQPDGEWRVTAVRGRMELGYGRETHPALAACDANDVAWAERDRRQAAQAGAEG